MVSFLTSSIVILVLAHMAATLVGVGSITVAEWQYFRALSDGRIDDGERAHLVALFFSLRFALTLVLLTDILLGFAVFLFPHAPEIGLSAPYWFEMFIILSLIIASWLRFHGRIPFWAGSAVAFTGWWYLAGMALGYIPVESFGAAVIGLVVSVAVISGVFSYARFLAKGYSQKA